MKRAKDVNKEIKVQSRKAKGAARKEKAEAAAREAEWEKENIKDAKAALLDESWLDKMISAHKSLRSLTLCCGYDPKSGDKTHYSERNEFDFPLDPQTKPVKTLVAGLRRAGYKVEFTSETREDLGGCDGDGQRFDPLGTYTTHHYMTIKW